MTLKTKFQLVTCALVLLALLVSELVTLSITEAFLTEHAYEMETPYGDSAVIESLRIGRQALLSHLALLHLLIAAVTVALFVSVLHLAWKRVVEKRLNSMLHYMSWMERGNWQAVVPETGNDEITTVAQAVNRLGSQFTTTTQQFGDASKLAALALIGQTLVREVAVVHDQLCGTWAMLKLRGEHNEQTLQQATRSLDSAIRSLESVPRLFQDEFDRQFQRYATKPSVERQEQVESSTGLAGPKPCEIGTPNARTSSEAKQGTRQ